MGAWGVRGLEFGMGGIGRGGRAMSDLRGDDARARLTADCCILSSTFYLLSSDSSLTADRSWLGE